MTTSSHIAPAPRDELRESLRAARDELRQRVKFTEEDTRNVLISPFLRSLGYDALHRSAELTDHGNIPDEIIYSEPPGTSPSRYCQIILEAKALETNLDDGPSRTETPERQLKRYLRNHQASGPDTFGILTDGEKYRVYQRTGEIADIRYCGEYNILEPSPQLGVEVSDPIDELFEMLHRKVLSANVRNRVDKYRAARELCNLISDARSSSTQILNILCSTARETAHLSENELTGRAKDAFQNDWKYVDWRYGPFAYVDNPRLDGSPNVVTASVKFSLPENNAPVELRRGDVSLAARTFATKSDCRTAIVIARQPDREGTIDRARIAVQYLGHTGMTSEFDPHNPPMSVLRSIERIIDVLKSSPPVSGQKLSDAVTVRTIRKEFYEAISNWTRARQRGRNEVFRQTVLRHLIRTVFAWILKEDGIIPNELFEESFALRHGGENYHRDVLMFMFHEGLNKSTQERNSHRDPAIDKAIEEVPFLNGSLFAEHDGDAGFGLKLEHYFGVSEDDPGLFTIMSRYDWTTAEHTPGESDQTIDPEMLSNLFENLFAATESDEVQKTMPRGTYYTPSDVVAEMVKDALTAATERFTPPPPFGTQVLHRLFSDAETELPALTRQQISDFKRELLNLSIFDPSVGSGAFLLVVANALARAVKKLDPDSADPTRDIIQKQLFGQDINPMATQITRLRLFIAIMAAERGRSKLKPLPNLEGRIVCADTLANVASPDWSFETALGLTGADKNIRETLRERWGVVQMWAYAHSEDEKEWVLQQDETTRMRLQDVLRQTGNEDHAELMSFAKHELLAVDAKPVATDSRLIFYDENRRGFDIVIGNPPYEIIAKDFSTTDRTAIKNNLRDKKQYVTTRGNNLYNLFCEVALALAKPDGGVVTLIVPLSLAFAQAQQPTRRLFEHRSRRIWLRHQDNGPDMTFHESPVANPTNRQRTTIVTALLGEGQVVIKTTGTCKWLKSERELFLRHRSYVSMPALPATTRKPLSEQWPRIPTGQIGDLIVRMASQTRTLGDFSMRNGDETIALPNTAYEFITVAPMGKLDRIEKTISFGSRNQLELVIALLNGHPAYTWWRVWSDTLNITLYQFSGFPIPDKWLDDSLTNREARRLGRALINAIVPANIKGNKSGTGGQTFENVDFHETCPDLIEEIDMLYLDALDLLDDRLLAQLHKLRSNSNWRFD